jgi:hypothetical protein
MRQLGLGLLLLCADCVRAPQPTQALAAEYFPAGRLDHGPRYAAFLAAMTEVPLMAPAAEVSAFRMLDLPSLGTPVSMRVVRRGGHAYLVRRSLTGRGESPKPGRLLNRTEGEIPEPLWNRLQAAAERAQIGAIEFGEERAVELDGIQVLYERRVGEHYEVVVRSLGQVPSLDSLHDLMHELEQASFKSVGQ